MRFILILFLFLLSEGKCLADDGCSYREESLLKDSSKYAQQVKINMRKIEDRYTIDIRFPLKIEEGEFKEAFVVKLHPKNSEELFVFPISMSKDGYFYTGWFNIDSSIASQLFLYIDFGTECGFTIKKQIEFKPNN